MTLTSHWIDGEFVSTRPNRTDPVFNSASGAQTAGNGNGLRRRCRAATGRRCEAALPIVAPGDTDTAPAHGVRLLRARGQVQARPGKSHDPGTRQGRLLYRSQLTRQCPNDTSTYTDEVLEPARSVLESIEDALSPSNDNP